MATETLKIIIKAVDQASQAFNKIAGGSEAMGKQLQKTGAAMTRNLTLPIVAIGAAAVKTFADFDKVMTNFEARTGATAQQMERVREVALQMGRDTQFSSTQATEALLELVSSGSSVEEAIEVLPNVLDLAAAGMLELGESADLVTDIMAQFRLASEDTTMITDALVQAAASSSATVADLGDAMKNVGPVAANFGMSVEETAAALAVLAENGIKSSDAGTAMRRILTELGSDSNRVSAVMQQLGVSVEDAAGNFRPFDDIIKDINAGLEGMGAVERARTINELAGVFGQTGLSALLAADGIDEMMQKMEEQQTAAEVAAKQAESFSAQLNMLKGSLQTLAIKVIGPLVENVLLPFVGVLIDITNALSDAPPFIQQMTVAFLAFVAAAGPVLFIVGKLMTAWSLITKVWTAATFILPMLNALMGMFAAILGFILSPIGLVIAAGIALGVALKLLIDNWDAVTEAAGKFGEVLRDALDGAVESIKRFAIDALKLFVKLSVQIADVFSGVVDGLIDFVASLPGLFWNMVTNILESIIKAVRDQISGWINAIKDFAQGAVDTIKGVFQIGSPSKVMQEIGTNAGDSFTQAFAGSLNSGMGQIQKQMGQQSQNMMATVQKPDTSGFIGHFANVFQQNRGAFEAAAAKIAATQYGDEGKETAATVMNNLLQAFNQDSPLTAGTFIQKYGVQMGDALQQTMAALIPMRNKMIQEGWTMGADFITAVKSALGIQSPSKEMAKIGEQAISGFDKGLSAGAGMVAAPAGQGMAGGGGNVIIGQIIVPPGTTREQVDAISKEIAKRAQRRRGMSGRSTV